MPPIPKAVRIRTASGWQDIAMGAQGPTGPTGSQGPQGAKGDPGGVVGSEVGTWVSGSNTGISAGVHTLIPIGSSADANNTAGVTRQSDGSLLITAGGWYQVTGLFSAAQAPGAGFLEYRLLYATDGSAPSTSWPNFAYADSPCIAGEYPHYVLTSPPGYFPAGAKIACSCYCSIVMATGMSMAKVGITRCGGGVGPKGDPGGASNAIAQTYTVQAAYTKDRTFYPGGFVTPNEIAIVLATLIDDMKAAGLITGP